jgi:hypothetical protein
LGAAACLGSGLYGAYAFEALWWKAMAAALGLAGWILLKFWKRRWRGMVLH